MTDRPANTAHPAAEASSGDFGGKDEPAPDENRTVAPPGTGGRDREEYPADTPATVSNVLRWACGAGWTARDDEWGGIRIVFAEVTNTGLTVLLDNGQVFELTAEELTRPSGQPGHPLTLNPAGPPVTHATIDGAPLCGWSREGETASPDWPEVTCLDCRLAAPATDLSALDGLNVAALAGVEVRDVLTEAAPRPLSAYQVMSRVGRAYRADVPAILTWLAETGAAVQVAGPDATTPAWRLT